MDTGRFFDGAARTLGEEDCAGRGRGDPEAWLGTREDVSQWTMAGTTARQIMDKTERDRHKEGPQKITWNVQGEDNPRLRYLRATGAGAGRFDNYVMEWNALEQWSESIRHRPEELHVEFTDALSVVARLKRFLSLPEAA
jgi:hypothetical protein